MSNPAAAARMSCPVEDKMQTPTACRHPARFDAHADGSLEGNRKEPFPQSANRVYKVERSGAASRGWG
jgi:hypothetical protein